MTLQRFGNQLTVLPNNGQIGGWNHNGTIALTNVSFASNLAEAVYHEVGHNWDDPTENTYATAFRQLSDWRHSANQPTANYVASTAW